MTEILIEEKQEETEGSLEKELSAVIKSEPGKTAVDPELVQKVLFTERKAAPPAPKPIPQQPVARKPLDPAHQAMKNKLKSMIFEAWNELEK